MNVYHLFQYFFLGMQIAFVIDGNYPVSLVCAAASLAFGVVNIIKHWPNIDL
jgi:hypothetical protein